MADDLTLQTSKSELLWRQDLTSTGMPMKFLISDSPVKQETLLS